MNPQTFPESISFAAHPPSAQYRQVPTYLWYLLAAALLLLAYRIALMALLPLADTTEARYGEIARQAVSNGYWLMPHIDPHTPFFAKPPLSTWASAVSMQIFGINEFAARLPALLASLLAIVVAMGFAREMKLRRSWLVAPVLAASPLFFLCAGAVMTDALQMVIIVAALYFAWRTLNTVGDEAFKWRLAFWSMVGLGALCKGLATWALIGLPLIAYALVERRPWQMLRQVFSWGGLALALGIFMPWYIAAEYNYPGFLNYFIIGEHFSRFLVPGWKGDHYGIAQQQPMGAIWIFWSIGILPWLAVFISELLRFFSKRAKPSLAIERFLWCATLAPLLFFTFSRNIIWTYGLTAALPFSVLVARWLENASATAQTRTGISLALLAVVALMCGPYVVSKASANSDRDLIQAFHRLAAPGTQLAYRVHPEYSSDYYARNALHYEPDAALSKNTKNELVVVDRNELTQQAIAADHILFVGKNRALIRPE